MKDIVIFGGAFDPIHFGHLNMALNAAKALNAEVFFVPARISVWKEETAPIEDKINMIDLAIKSINAEEILKISDYEARSEKDLNYTIDTVKYFKNKYPESKLYLLIGTDHVNSFHKWKDSYEISSLAQIVFFPRPNLVLDQNNIKNYSMKMIEGEMYDASSTDIRSLNKLETPINVLKYICEHKLYFSSKIKEFLEEKRYNHSIQVAVLAYEVAFTNNLVNPSDYFIAGILHDIGKNMSIDEQKKLIDKLFCEYKDVNPKIYHQFTGRYLAEKVFHVNNKDILNAIQFHTTGRANMSDIEKIIYCSDKIEPTRQFDSSELIRAIKDNYETGFVTILKANKKFFEDNKIDYDNFLTKQCMEYYL